MSVAPSSTRAHFSGVHAAHLSTGVVPLRARFLVVFSRHRLVLTRAPWVCDFPNLTLFVSSADCTIY